MASDGKVITLPLTECTPCAMPALFAGMQAAGGTVERINSKEAYYIVRMPDGTPKIVDMEYWAERPDLV